MQTAKKIDLSVEMEVLHSYLRTKAFARWSTSSNIRERTGLSAIIVRRVCQRYPALFVSSTDGYKLAAYATRAEIQHCVATLISRSDKMIRRAAVLSSRLAA